MIMYDFNLFICRESIVLQIGTSPVSGLYHAIDYSSGQLKIAGEPLLHSGQRAQGASVPIGSSFSADLFSSINEYPSISRKMKPITVIGRNVQR